MWRKVVYSERREKVLDQQSVPSMPISPCPCKDPPLNPFLNMWRVRARIPKE
jgi:hypothetical protein